MNKDTLKRYLVVGILTFNLLTYIQYRHFGLSYERATVEIGVYTVLALILIASTQQ
jgi:hypothetical protein